MLKVLLGNLEKTDVDLSFSLLKRNQFWALTIISLCVFFPVNTVFANEKCNDLRPNESWQQTVSGMNGWQTWVGNNLVNYMFDLETPCNCPEPPVVRITVCEGNVFSAEDLNTGSMVKDSAMLKSYDTIMGYFTLIQHLQSDHPDEIRVKLNRYLGYPEDIWINPSYKMGDDEINIRINKVVPLTYH